MTSEEFIKKFGWSAETYTAAAESNFRCVYCGLYFFASVDTWTQFNKDHINPGEGKGHRDESVANLAAACWTCNKYKGVFNPAKVNPLGTKQELIAIAGAYIREVRDRRAIKVEQMHNEVNI